MNARSVSSADRARIRWSILAFVVIAGLAACGGGDPETAQPEESRKQAAAAASGTVVQRIQTRDKFAFASYFEYANDCEQFAVEVFASEALIRSDGAPTSSSLVRAQLSSFDVCTGSLAFMSGFTETEVIKIRKDLTHATAAATIVMQDEFGTAKTVVINLAWDGGVLSFDQKDKVVTVTPVSKTVVKTVGQVRTSETVSGALVLDGVDLLAPGRPVISNGISGFVTSSKGSTIEIVRTH